MPVTVTRYEDSMFGVSYYPSVRGVQLPRPCLTKAGAYVSGYLYLLSSLFGK